VTGLRGWPREAARRNLSIGRQVEYELAALLESISIPRIEVPVKPFIKIAIG
jgi:hypothetical protein